MSKREVAMSSEMAVISTPYWALEGTVSNGFNRLKAQIFNLVDALSLEGSQKEAIKGLVRGFANEEYRRVVTDMREDAKLAGYLSKEQDESIPPLTATPLGQELMSSDPTVTRPLV